MHTENRTLAIIKPSAVAAGETGKIISRIEAAGFRVVAMVHTTLSHREAGVFYGVHAGKPFYHELCGYLSSGPIVALALEQPQAVERFRALLGATDPASAAPGTLRKEFGRSLSFNAVHGSDAPETAAQEIAFFFAGREVL